VGPAGALPEPAYFSPAGPDGGTLSNAPDAPTIVRNPDGSYSQSSGGAAPRRAMRAVSGGWVPWTPTPGRPVVTRVQSGLSEPVPAGSTSAAVFALADLGLLDDSAWFSAGRTVVLDLHGPNEETATLTGVDPLRFAAPLTRSHRMGERVIELPVRPDPAPAGTVPPVGGPTPAEPSARPGAPRLSGAKLVKRTFARRTGTKLSFTLDRAATVTAKLERLVSGRRKGKACSPTARRGRRCTARVAAGSRRFDAKAGRTTVAFGKGLRRGRYVATLRTAGGTPVVLRFTVR
jgi:hypothetical protein